MRIGIVSDTHGDLWATQEAVRVLAGFRVNLVIHCGDIGSREIIALLAPWPAHFVLGNVDHADSLRAAIEQAGQTCHGRRGSLRLDDRAVAFLHGDDTSLLRRLIRSGRWDLVCHGHTHVARQSIEAATLVVNPGAVGRTGSPSLAVVDLASLEAIPVSW